MNRGLRALAGAALAIGTLTVAPAVASAQVLGEGCEDDGAGYVPGGVCELVIEVDVLCENDVPMIAYRASGATSAAGASITWVNPGGADVVQAGLPMEGVVRWPGAVVDADGNPTDWPGWTRLESGEWVEGDEFDWARSPVEVLVTVNPTASVTVTYPPAPAGCAPSGEASSNDATPVSAPLVEQGEVQAQAELARTGTSAASLA
uniref:peptidase n=1 Tax=Actinotalea sp. C106 TaxID=2908644 RepID=UPI002028B25C